MSVLTRGAADFVVAVVTAAAAGDLVAVTVLGAAAVAVAWDFEGAGFISLKIKIHNPAEFVAQIFMVYPNQIFFLTGCGQFISSDATQGW